MLQSRFAEPSCSKRDGQLSSAAGNNSTPSARIGRRRVLWHAMSLSTNSFPVLQLHSSLIERSLVDIDRGGRCLIMGLSKVIGLRLTCLLANLRSGWSILPPMYPQNEE